LKEILIKHNTAKEYKESGEVFSIYIDGKLQEDWNSFKINMHRSISDGYPTYTLENIMSTPDELKYLDPDYKEG